ncbi:Protein CBG17534 [Caenorhabditis briggsae]|uniref:receptor protein-tyrosine kinase n=1 Tax=Caenorhabditis briggsae TaxID=6238 RepID=A8XR67_CAEBR|nr:Protein CBG17534 [Caenorhabditis briggsae]CAP35164.1 Protein CBG17534 [Caenorhabditis briggsae]
MNTSLSVQWEVAIENEQPDVHITVHEPSLFTVLNQQFYPPDTHLRVDCVSISIPPADVTFERTDRESGDFVEIDQELLKTYAGTFERRFVWNMTLDEDTELRCTSTRNGNKYPATKAIIVADQFFTVFSAFEKSDKATSRELPNVIYEGDNVKLTCVVPNEAADWDVSWRFKNKTLELSGTEVRGHSKLLVLDLKKLNMLYQMIRSDPGPMPEYLTELPIEERTDYLPYPRKFEIARENLEICAKMGSVKFGFVEKGYLSMADPKSQIECKTRLPVAIKSTKRSFDVELQTMLFEELKIMCAIEKHPNVISLIGAVTTNMRKGEIYLVTEYADSGDFLNYLQKRKDIFHNGLFDDQQKTESTRFLPSGDNLSTLDLISFALQIANGMKFLATVPCVHRDLAARNVLITSSKICRIADFRLARRYADKNYYRIKNGKQIALPIPWMAPEALETLKFTEKNDVWSYGITLYEIFTLGGQPYPHVQTEDIKAFLKSGKRNEQPEYCHYDVCSTFLIINELKFDCSAEHLFEKNMLLARIDEQLHTELEKQYKLEEWLMTNRPDIQGGTFTSRPENN